MMVSALVACQRNSEVDWQSPMKRISSLDVPILAAFSLRVSYFREPVVAHQEHEINVALSGWGTYHLSGGEQMSLAAGEILLLPGGVQHGIEVPTGLHMGVIHVHPSAMRGVPMESDQADLAQRLRGWRRPLPVRKVIDPESHAVLHRLTEDAMIERTQHRPSRAAAMKALAMLGGVYFLRLMAISDVGVEPDEATRRILAARSWIDRHFAEPCRLEQLADMAHLAPTYFASRFQQIVGKPPMTYLRERRLEQARLLVQQSDQPIKAVAASVGYERVDHFTHAFKRATGVTPTQYRQRQGGR